MKTEQQQEWLSEWAKTGEGKFDWFSMITPKYAKFILKNLETSFNRFAYNNGWELSDKAKEIVKKRLEEIARKDNVN